MPARTHTHTHTHLKAWRMTILSLGSTRGYCDASSKSRCPFQVYTAGTRHDHQTPISQMHITHRHTAQSSLLMWGRGLCLSDARQWDGDVRSGRGVVKRQRLREHATPPPHRLVLVLGSACHVQHFNGQIFWINHNPTKYIMYKPLQFSQGPCYR